MRMNEKQTDLSELFERLKMATGPDREIDVLMLCALPPFGINWSPDPRWPGRAKFSHSIGDMDSRLAASFTASIDAAVALVERLLPGWKWGIHDHAKTANFKHAYVLERSPLRPIPFQGEAPTAPLAILTALLSALSKADKQ